jgi:Na+:H+ antiporter, NhaA family
MSKRICDLPTGLAIEKLGGVGLILATGGALVWANSPAQESYEALRRITFEIPFNPALTKSLKEWVNEGLMAFFFLMVGLEIKREFIEGDLADVRHASLTVIAAMGGMVVPVAIYLAFNGRGAGLVGWAIPMATDIAFAVGLVSLVGGRATTALRLFLVALAVVDDLGAVLVIALFYGHDLSFGFLAGAAAIFLIALAYGRRRRAHPLIVAALGLALWYCVLRSGIHATIAGVLLAVTIPLRSRQEHPDSVDFEEQLTPWVLLLVVPVFALFNAGVTFKADLIRLSPITLGIALGLILGKPIGILGACWLGVRADLGRLPDGLSWLGLTGLSVLAGLGFTMSLFIAQLAFEEGAQLAQSKVAILCASTLAAIVGLAMIRLVVARQW